MSEMVERVAEAIRREIGTRHRGLPKGGWDGLMKKAAIAAIEAMREPSDAMVAAFYSENTGDPTMAWEPIIDAALKSRSK